eukprot:g1686.t1
MSSSEIEDSASSSSSEVNYESLFYKSKILFQDEGILSIHKKLKFSETLDKIRNRDSMIYSKDEVFFESDDDSSNVNKEHERLTQPLYIKDVTAQQLLEQGAEAYESESEAEEEEEEIENKKQWIYDDEQQKLRDEVLVQINSFDEQAGSEHDDFGGFQKSQIQTPLLDPEVLHSTNQVKKCLDSYFAQETELKPEDAEFLKNYIEQEEWRVDNRSSDGDLDEHLQEDEEYLENEARFEADYNFRFEEPGSNQLVGYPRVMEQTIRQKESARKRQRANKSAKKQQKRMLAEEQTKQQKNAKRKEIQSKLSELTEECGAHMDTKMIEQLLDSDNEFDAREWDSKMEQTFNDEFYNQVDEDAEFKLGGSSKNNLQDCKQELGRLFNEYYNLDYEDDIDGVKTRYRYMKVPKQNYGLSVEDILCLDDKELNEFVGLRRLNPYRDDLASFKHHRGKLKKVLSLVDYTGDRSRENKQAKKTVEHEDVEETHLLTKIEQETDPKVKARLESYSRLMLQPYREKKNVRSDLNQAKDLSKGKCQVATSISHQFQENSRALVYFASPLTLKAVTDPEVPFKVPHRAKSVPILFLHPSLAEACNKEVILERLETDSSELIKYMNIPDVDQNFRTSKGKNAVDVVSAFAVSAVFEFLNVLENGDLKNCLIPSLEQLSDIQINEIGEDSMNIDQSLSL